MRGRPQNPLCRKWLILRPPTVGGPIYYVYGCVLEYTPYRRGRKTKRKTEGQGLKQNKEYERPIMAPVPRQLNVPRGAQSRRRGTVVGQCTTGESVMKEISAREITVTITGINAIWLLDKQDHGIIIDAFVEFLLFKARDAEASQAPAGVDSRDHGEICDRGGILDPPKK